MAYKITKESAVKLQAILSKKLGRQLTERELDVVYCNLIEFTYVLLSMADLEYLNETDTSCNAKERN